MVCCPTCNMEYAVSEPAGISVTKSRLVTGRRSIRITHAIASLMTALCAAGKEGASLNTLCDAIGPRCGQDSLKVHVHNARKLLDGTGFEIVSYYGQGYGLRGAPVTPHGEAGR